MSGSFTAAVCGGLIAAISSTLGFGIDTWQFWAITAPLSFVAGAGVGVLNTCLQR